MSVLVGISLKMYFGYQQTLDWCRDIAGLVAERTSDDVEVFVLPSFPALPAVLAAVGSAGITVGAQDLAADEIGAQTGEVGAALLAELGCQYVEVGHAERRRLFGETDAVVAAKTANALRHGLIPILCLGETEHQSAESAAGECLAQLGSALQDSRDAGLSGRIIVAYEPVWAIGATSPAPADHIATVCDALRAAFLDLPQHADSAVIYGGSAGPGLFTSIAEHVNGLFLGRFAHDPAQFAAVLDEVQALNPQEVSS